MGSNKESMSRVLFDALAEKYKFSLDTPFKELSEQAKEILFYGTKGEKVNIT